MAGTVVRPVGRPPAAGTPAPEGRPRLLRRVTGQAMPDKLRALLVAMVILSLAWGGLGAWTVAEHSSAANSLAYTDEPYSRDAQRLYLALADADVTITTSFLNQSTSAAGGRSPAGTLTAQRRLEADLASAGGYLGNLMNSSGNTQLKAAVAAISTGLADYKGDIATAQTEYAQGITPAGDSEMEVASEEAHLVLLPAAKTIYQVENAAVSASKGQATSLPTILLAALVAIAALIALLWTQSWLTRRTSRVVNLGLAVTTAALLVSGGWLAVTFSLASSHLATAIGQGANPAESLALASIDVQQIRGDSILNVIARSGTTSLQADSAMEAKAVGPGAGSLLAAAAAAGNGQVTAAIGPAIAAAPGWYTVNQQGYALGAEYNFAAEQALVVRTAVPGYNTVENSIDKALAAAQATFDSEASAGASAFGALEAVVIVTALLMAAASAYGLTRRLAEYR